MDDDLVWWRWIGQDDLNESAMQRGRIGTLFGGAKKRHILLWEFDYGPESNVLVVDGRALFEPILVQGQISGTNNSFFSAATRPWKQTIIFPLWNMVWRA